MSSNVGKKCLKLWCVLCAMQFVTHKLHGTQHTPQLGKFDKSICLRPICMPKVRIHNFSECRKACCHNTEKLITMYFTD
jgi:hypothetical protein